MVWFLGFSISMKQWRIILIFKYINQPTNQQRYKTKFYKIINKLTENLDVITQTAIFLLIHILNSFVHKHAEN